MASGSVPAIHMMFAIAKYGEVAGVTIYNVTVAATAGFQFKPHRVLRDPWV
jgi:hypothetical protein